MLPRHLTNLLQNQSIELLLVWKTNEYVRLGFHICGQTFLMDCLNLHD